MTKTQKQKFKNHNKQRRLGSKKRKAALDLNLFIIILLGAILVNAVSYVVVKNDLSVKGFVINELQKELYSLEEKKSKLEVEAMSMQSYNNVAKRVEGLEMIKVGKIDYINLNGDYVAKK